MKKMYKAPQTEAIQLLAENVIMATSNPIRGTNSGYSTNY